MKGLKFRSYQFLAILIAIFSFFISIWQAQYIYDGHHWGLMASNAKDLLEGKTPYRDIFVQYGLFTTIIHSFFMKISDFKVISIFYGTSLIYSISMLYFYKLINNKFKEYFALFGITCLFLVHPFTNHPWHNYLTFFFIILSLFFIEKKKYHYKFLSGFFFSLAILSYEKLFIVIIFFLLSYFFLSLKKKKLMDFYFLIFGLLLPLIIFFIYLNLNQIFKDWLNYHSISSLYINANYIFVIFDFFINLIKKSFTKIIFEPYWLLFVIIIIVNIYIIFLFFKNKNFLEDKDEYLINYSVISLCSFSSAIHSLNSFRLATGSIIGLFALIYLINRLKKEETKKMILLSIIIFLSLGINFKKSENNKLYISPVSYDHYINKQINFFDGLRLKKDTWENLIFVNTQLKDIKIKCNDIKYGVNFTNNSYYYLLLSDIFDTFQIKPWINVKSTLDKNTMNLINPKFEKKLNQKIFENNTILITNFSYRVPKNYDFINLPYSYEDKYKKILMPKNCKNNL